MNAVFMTSALLSIAGASLAIVVIDDQQYTERPENAVVGKLKNGTCVPIGARYAVTANHVGVQVGHNIELDGQLYRVKSIHPHPDVPSRDLKVLEIDGPPFFSNWFAVHPDPTSVPSGTPVHIGGWGRTTDSVDGDCILWGPREERWAMNELEGHVSMWSWYRFDAELPNEGIAAVYDSGSPLAVADAFDCSLWLLGVATSATSGSTGPSCDDHTAHYVQIDTLWIQPFCGPVCDGDLDNDADTDVLDFAELLGSFGDLVSDTDCAARTSGDLNQDGIVDVHDVVILIQDFGCAP